MECRVCKKEKSWKEGLEILNPGNGKFVFVCNDCKKKGAKNE